MSKTDTEIVDGYIALRHASKGSPKHDELFWAFNEMCDIVAVDPDRAFKLILMILGKDDSPEVVQILAAGPLEDLLADHGEAMIGKVEAEARKNPKFAFLLGGVWPSSIAKNIWRKVEILRERQW